MSIIKYFILLFLILNKIKCSPYNHLDFQLALLILSAGDHGSKIVLDPNTKDYLKININKEKKRSYKVDIVDIIPSLKEIRDGTPKTKSNDITKKFKELYEEAEYLVCNKMGHQCNSNNSLFQRYKNTNTQQTMRN